MQIARRTTLALLAAAAPLFPAAPDAAEKPHKGGSAAGVVRHRGKSFAAETLPDEIDEPARRAIQLWAPWAEEHGYRMELVDDQRLLLVVERGAPGQSGALRRLGEVSALFDRIAPAPAAAAETAAGSSEAAPGEASAPVPTPVPAPVPAPAPTPVADDPNWTTEAAPDSQTAVLFAVDGEEDFAALVVRSAQFDSYLQEWAAGAKKLPGFVLARPLAAAWRADGAGQEEWSSEAEMVNRAAQLLCLRRFGPQPNWIGQGLAWYIEEEIRGSIHCFPNRTGFVAVEEHGGWDKALAQHWGAGERKGRVPIEALAGFRRGTYDAVSAQTAWGAVTWLVRHGEDGALGPVLEGLRTARSEQGRQWIDDFRWMIPADYELPAAAQAAVLAECAGEDALEELGSFFRKGKSYRHRK